MQECFRIYKDEKQSNTEACLIAVHGLGLLGLMFCLMTFTEKAPVVAMIICVVAAVAIPVWKNKVWKMATLVAILLFTVIYMVGFRQWFNSGIFQFANNVIALFNYNYGKEILYYTLPKGISEEPAYNIFLCYALTLIGFMIRFILEEKRVVIYVICNFLVVVSFVLFKDSRAGLGCIFACISVIGAIMWKNLNNESGGRRLTVYMYVSLVTGLLISFGYYNFADYTSNLAVAKMKDSAISGTQDMIYGEKDAPEGDLSYASTYEGDDKKRIKVTVDTPGVYYLKGYVGGVYKNGVWNEIDKSSYNESYEGIFHWMKEKNFHPLSQNSEYIKIAKDKDGFDSKKVTIKIENKNANKRYNFIPYGLTSESLEEFSNINRDMNVLGSAGSTSSYEVQFEDYDIASCFAYENPDWLNSAVTDQEINDFRDAQVEYRTFVYDNYLQLDKDWKKYFDSSLDETNVNGYVSITNAIRKWLADESKTSESTKTKDYLMYFLTKARKGNSSFYASAGTLMYRYYGIPARYVEGYLADMKEKTGKHEKELTGANVHAWVEIYRDGIGWVPVDVTPGFYTELEVSKQIQMKQQQIMNDANEQEEEDNNRSQKQGVNFGYLIAIIIMSVVGLILLSFITIIVRRIIICHHRERLLREENMKVAMPCWMRFMKQLLKFNEQDEGSLSEDVSGIIERYRFRDGEMSGEDYAAIREYAYETQHLIYNKVGRRKKLKMKYMFGLI